MTAFGSEKTRAMTFTDVDGRPITLRPVHDAGLGRNVVELVVHGATVRLSNGKIPKFVDSVTLAAFLGEMDNVAQGNPTPAGA